MDLQRIVRHLLTASWLVKRYFPAVVMEVIEGEIRDSERSHAGEICFVVEATLEPGRLLRGQSARERALEVFSQLRVWDTEYNSGVLIYLLLADRDVEIVADRGIATKVSPADWEAVCQQMETGFRAGHFEAGAVAGIRAVSALLASHFPAGLADRDELSNRFVTL